MLALAITISCAVQIAVSLYVFKKGRSNFSYLLFFFLSLTTLIWAVLNYLSVVLISEPYLIWIIRTIMMFAVIETGLFYLFSNAFPDQDTGYSYRDLYGFLGFTLLTAGLTLTPYLFKSVYIDNGVINASTGPGVIVFTLYIAFYIISSFNVLFHKLRTFIGLKRRQVLILILAAAINWVLVPLTNFVLTLILKTMVFVEFSPLYSLAFASIIGYALLRHRMFDSAAVLKSSTIYVSNYLRNKSERALEYYVIRSLVYKSESDHVALDFSGVESLENDDAALLKKLRKYMSKQGKKIYFVGYTQKVFNQLRPLDD